MFAVYTVLSELVERLRSGQSNETREATFRTFTGRYVIDSGLIPFLMQLGGFTALGDPVSGNAPDNCWCSFMFPFLDLL